MNARRMLSSSSEERPESIRCAPLVRITRGSDETKTTKNRDQAPGLPFEPVQTPRLGVRQTPATNQDIPVHSFGQGSPMFLVEISMRFRLTFLRKTGTFSSVHSSPRVLAGHLSDKKDLCF